MRLSESGPLHFRAVIAVLIVGCAGLFFLGIKAAFAGDWFSCLLAIGLWLPLGIGLWQLRPLARKVVVGVLWCIVVVVPVAAINPFAAINGDGPPFRPVGELVALIYPWVVASLFALHVLGKHKGEFRGDNRSA